MASAVGSIRGRGRDSGTLKSPAFKRTLSTAYPRQKYYEVVNHLKETVEIKDRMNILQLETYKDCFLAEDAITLVLKYLNLGSREEALQVCKEMNQKLHCWENVCDDQEMEDTNLFFRFTQDSKRQSGCLAEVMKSRRKQKEADFYASFIDYDAAQASQKDLMHEPEDHKILAAAFGTETLREIVKHMKETVVIKDRMQIEHLKIHKNCFLAEDAVSVAQEFLGLDTREQSVEVCKVMNEKLHCWEHVSDSREIEDAPVFFRFKDPKERSGCAPSARSSEPPAEREPEEESTQTVSCRQRDGSQDSRRRRRARHSVSPAPPRERHRSASRGSRRVSASPAPEQHRRRERNTSQGARRPRRQTSPTRVRSSSKTAKELGTRSTSIGSSEESNNPREFALAQARVVQEAKGRGGIPASDDPQVSSVTRDSRSRRYQGLKKKQNSLQNLFDDSLGSDSDDEQQQHKRRSSRGRSTRGQQQGVSRAASFKVRKQASGGSNLPPRASSGPPRLASVQKARDAVRNAKKVQPAKLSRSVVTDE